MRQSEQAGREEDQNIGSGSARVQGTARQRSWDGGRGRRIDPGQHRRRNDAGRDRDRDQPGGQAGRADGETGTSTPALTSKQRQTGGDRLGSKGCYMRERGSKGQGRKLERTGNSKKGVRGRWLDRRNLQFSILVLSVLPSACMRHCEDRHVPTCLWRRGGDKRAGAQCPGSGLPRCACTVA
jgi:hypothetical protein